jgi:isopenicillin-N N-acyltransferase-like protein
VTVPEVVLSGAPYEKGLAHGRAMRAGVLRSIDTYRAMFLRRKGLAWDDARALARGFVPALEGPCAPLAEEMRGIAAGAGVGFEDVLVLNLRSEILYSALVPPKAPPPPSAVAGGECTAFSATPPATAGGAILAGQTWDYAQAQREASFLARFPAEGGTPALLLMLEAGMVGGKGVNAAGLCLTLNALSSPGTAIGAPLHLRMRLVLEAPDMAEAVRRAKAGPIPAPACLTLTHRSGESVAIELAPGGADELRPEGGILVHTNHFVGPRAATMGTPAPESSTRLRRERLLALLRGRPGLSSADAEGFLADHENRERGGSVCVHPRPGTPPEDLPLAGATNYAFVADLAAGRLRFAMGNPCEGGFEDVPFAR